MEQEFENSFVYLNENCFFLEYNVLTHKSDNEAVKIIVNTYVNYSLILIDFYIFYWSNLLNPYPIIILPERTEPQITAFKVFFFQLKKNIVHSFSWRTQFDFSDV